jgi:hypothetical protein
VLPAPRACLAKALEDFLNAEGAEAAQRTQRKLKSVKFDFLSLFSLRSKALAG